MIHSTSDSDNRSHVLLVNANPYEDDYMSSYGLEIIKSYCEVQHENRYCFEIINPFHESDHPVKKIAGRIREKQPVLIGLSIRNFDNAYTVEDTDSPSEVQTRYYLRKLRRLVQVIRRISPGVPIIAGGATFSYYPELIMNYFDLNMGIAGPGEYTFSALLELLANNQLDTAHVLGLPGLAVRTPEGIEVSKKRYSLENETYYDLKKDTAFKRLYDFPRRRFPMYPSYQFPVRTHSGCGLKCSYCVEALNYGISYRPVENVIQEIEHLVENYQCKEVFFANGELNIPRSDYVIELCRQLIDRGLHKKIKWTSFLNIKPFTLEMAQLMKESGCYYVNFSVDNFHDDILKSLNKNFNVQDVLRTLGICEEVGLPTESGIMFGAPGDNKEIMDFNISQMRFYYSRGHIFKYICGLRIYPETQLHEHARAQGFKHTYMNRVPSDGSSNMMEPVLYCEGMAPRELLAYLKASFKEIAPDDGVLSREEQLEKNYFNRMMVRLSKNDMEGGEVLLGKLKELDAANEKYDYFVGEHYHELQDYEKSGEYARRALKCLNTREVRTAIDQVIYYQANKLIRQL